MRMFTRGKNPGFTLIELLVVVAIIGILAAVILAFLSPARMKARDTRRISDFREIRKALELYYNDYGSYPVIPVELSWANGWAFSHCSSDWATYPSCGWNE